MAKVDMSFDPTTNVFVTEVSDGFELRFVGTRDVLTLYLPAPIAWELLNAMLMAFKNAHNSPVTVKISYKHGMDVAIRHKEEVWWPCKGM